MILEVVPLPPIRAVCVPLMLGILVDKDTLRSSEQYPFAATVYKFIQQHG